MCMAVLNWSYLLLLAVEKMADHHHEQKHTTDEMLW